jgi:hypothetical protein
MQTVTQSFEFEDVEQVVAEPLRFKAKLAIGENAYASLRMINRTRELWDVIGAAGAGAAVAKSGIVASTFFAPSGVLGALGIGAATTPIGWVALAAVASGGACYGLYRWLGDTKGSRVIEIPKFLNTPLDTLGLALFDLIAPLALRLAAVDGEIEPAERAALVTHLVDEWGLDAGFVTTAIAQIAPRIEQGSVEEMAGELSAFLHANPDCNHQAIATDLGDFLRRLLEAGGPLSDAEEQALATSLALLRQEPDGALTKAWLGAKSGAGRVAEQLGSSAKDAADWTRERLPGPQELGAAAGKAWDGAKSGAEQLGTVAKEAAEWTRERLPSPEELQAAAATAAAQVEQSVRKAATWAQDKLPDADQVQDLAKRSADVVNTRIAQLKKRISRS